MARPSICETVKNRIYNVIHEFRLRNDFVLPAERELAEGLQVSRGTVRKALDMLENEGIIIRENQMTRILPTRKQKGRYAFCAASDELSRHFLFGLYYNLWEDLRLLSPDYEIELVLIPHQPDKCPAEILKKLKKYDIIFVSYIREPVVNSMKEANLPLVMLDEQNADCNYPLLCMDNREVGRCAASELLSGGCRSAMTVVYESGHYKPFELRRDGFISEFEAGGGSVMSVVNCKNTENPLESLNSLAEEIQANVKPETDGIFYISDEAISMVNWLFEKKICSNPDFKVTAFLGSGNFSKNLTQTEYWVMDNKSMISEMLFLIEKYENTQETPAIFCKRMAPVHYHKTIALSTRERKVK